MYKLSEPKRKAKDTPPHDCTDDVHRDFCGGGARGLCGLIKAQEGLKERSGRLSNSAWRTFLHGTLFTGPECCAT